MTEQSNGSVKKSESGQVVRGRSARPVLLLLSLWLWPISMTLVAAASTYLIVYREDLAQRSSGGLIIGPELRTPIEQRSTRDWAMDAAARKLLPGGRVVGGFAWDWVAPEPYRARLGVELQEAIAQAEKLQQAAEKGTP